MVDFLIVGSNNAINYINTSDLFLDYRLFVGYNTVTDFINTDKKVLSYWYSSFQVKKDPVVLECVYDKNKYLRFVNYDAINVDRIKDIPADYEGVMGVPLSFVLYFDDRQFELVGMPHIFNDELICIKKDDDTYKDIRLNNKHWFSLMDPVVKKNGEYICVFSRVFIKKK